jgi:hypothetical protein
LPEQPSLGFGLKVKRKGCALLLSLEMDIVRDMYSGDGI